MEKRIRILTVIVVVLVLICGLELFQIMELKSVANDIRGQVNGIQSSVSSEIQSMYSNIDSRLEEQASILVSQNQECLMDTVNPDDLTVDVKFEVVPKEFTNSTTAEIFIGEKSYPMQANGGTFTAVVKQNIFENSTDAKVVFTDGNEKRTEILDYFGNYTSEFSDYYFFGMETPNQKTGVVKDGVNVNLGRVAIVMTPVWYDENDPKAAINEKISDMRFFINVGGKEVFSKKIRTEDYETDAEPEYSPDTMDGPSSYIYYINCTKDIKIPKDETMECFLDFTDAYGIRHRSKLMEVYPMDNGIDAVFNSNWDDILDKEGNVVYQAMR